MADVCVDTEFQLDEAGVLQIRRQGDPAEAAWASPFCTATAGNGLRKAPGGGLWVPPDHTAGEVSEFVNYSPAHGIGAGYAWRATAAGWTLSNPSSCRAILYSLTVKCRWNIAMSPLGQGSIAIAKFGWDVDSDPGDAISVEDAQTHIMPNTGAQPYDVELGHIGAVSEHWTKILEPGDTAAVRAQFAAENVAGDIRVQQVRYVLVGTGVTI